MDLAVNYHGTKLSARLRIFPQRIWDVAVSAPTRNLQRVAVRPIVWRAEVEINMKMNLNYSDSKLQAHVSEKF